MKSFYIGSGDVANLMAGIHTKSHANLLKRFVSNEVPYFNAKASPIDALRTGAILEERYFLILDDSYYPQVRKTSTEMDVFKCSLDFAKIEDSKIVDFEELKTVNFNDFVDNLEQYKKDHAAGVEYVKKTYKKYYNQVQEQLYCTELESCTLVFLAVYSYEDEVNYTREIKSNEYIKFRIQRDDEVIEKIKARGLIFQQIKDCYSNGKKSAPKKAKITLPRTDRKEQSEKRPAENIITPEKDEKAVKELKKA